MKSNQSPQRKLIRLQGYDYSSAGFYFVTICVNRKECHFGGIHAGQMTFTELGRIANHYWLEIPAHYPHVVLHEHVVMPNHVHGIIELRPPEKHHGFSNVDVDAELDVPSGHGLTLPNPHPYPQKSESDFSSDTMESIIQRMNNVSHVHTHKRSHRPTEDRRSQFGKSIPGSISMILNQYKSSVKRWANANGHGYFAWQSRFHDHIIRDEDAYWAITNYIRTNPVRWMEGPNSMR